MWSLTKTTPSTQNPACVLFFPSLVLPTSLLSPPTHRSSHPRRRVHHVRQHLHSTSSIHPQRTWTPNREVVESAAARLPRHPLRTPTHDLSLPSRVMRESSRPDGVGVVLRERSSRRRRRSESHRGPSSELVLEPSGRLPRRRACPRRSSGGVDSWGSREVRRCSPGGVNFRGVGEGSSFGTRCEESVVHGGDVSRSTS